MELVRVRFDELVWEGIFARERTFFSADLPYVPGVGETVSVKGDPYVVRSRGFAVPEERDEEEPRLYAYLTVVPLGMKQMHKVRSEGPRTEG